MLISGLTEQLLDCLRWTEGQTITAVSDWLRDSIGYSLVSGAPLDGADYPTWIIATPPPDCAAPLAFVAHCDTVGDDRQPPQKFIDICGTIRRKRGGILGADDRAGVAAICAMVRDGARPTVILTCKEETGCHGARALIEDRPAPPPDIRVLVQIDRRGHSNYVTYGCRSSPLDRWAESFGLHKETGSFSDIAVLAPAWGIAAANMAAAYYDQHTAQESCNVYQLACVVDRACQMCARPPARALPYIAAPQPARRTTLWEDAFPPAPPAPAPAPAPPAPVVTPDYQPLSIIEERRRPATASPTGYVRCLECEDVVDWDQFDYRRNICQRCSRGVDEQIRRYSSSLASFHI